MTLTQLEKDAQRLLASGLFQPPLEYVNDALGGAVSMDRTVAALLYADAFFAVLRQTEQLAAWPAEQHTALHREVAKLAEGDLQWGDCGCGT